MEAAYVFRVRFRLDPAGVRVDPEEFETVVRVPAGEPGGEATGSAYDWLFFRDNLWRGEVNAPEQLRESAAELLGVEVVSVSFRELETDSEYFEALKAEMRADLDRFNADTVEGAVTKYLGSSIRVTD